MGTCETPGIVVQTEIENEDWATAVTQHQSAAVQMLHHQDAKLVNLPVDTTNGMAIHYAVTTIPSSDSKKALRDESMLEYLLENGANVNAQGGELFNSALHYAVIEIVKMYEKKEHNERIEPLWQCVRLLYRFGIKENLRNNENKTALDIIDVTFGDEKLLKTFKQRKYAGNEHGNTQKSNHTPVHSNSRNDSKEKPSGVLIGGMDLDDKANDLIIKKYIKDTSAATKVMKKKMENISKRTIPQTEFGEHCGVDPDEIAVEMQKIPDLGKVWHKCTKGHDTMEVHRQTDIYKILYSLTVMVLRKKNPTAKKPPQEAVKKLTVKISAKLPAIKGKHVLEKRYFVEEFYRLLYILHDELKVAYDVERGIYE